MKREALEKRRRAHKEHTKKRFMQRYNLALTDQEYEMLYRTIRDKYKGAPTPEGVTIKWVGMQSLTRVIYQILFKGVKAFVVYNRKTKRIVTVLPKEAEVPTVRSIDSEFVDSKRKKYIGKEINIR
jgi:hypothetical protein